MRGPLTALAVFAAVVVCVPMLVLVGCLAVAVVQDRRTARHRRAMWDAEIADLFRDRNEVDR